MVKKQKIKVVGRKQGRAVIRFGRSPDKYWLYLKNDRLYKLQDGALTECPASRDLFDCFMKDGSWAEKEILI